MALNKGKKNKRETGQSIVIIAVAFVGLICFVGLTVDMGLLFISYGHLRRAVDAAAIAAAAQIRENYSYTQLDAAATEYLRLNEVDLDNASAQVYQCDPGQADNDDTLCSPANKPKRKLVKVVATNKVDFSFLPVIGFYSTNVTASSVGEAASLDVVLAIDISESMSYNTTNTTGDPNDRSDQDPSVCNHSTTNPCQPMKKVKDAAKHMVDYVLNKTNPDDEEDRLSIVFFSNGWQDWQPSDHTYKGTYIIKNGTKQYSPGVTSGWFTDHDAAISAIDNLQVYDPDIKCQDLGLGTSTEMSPCRRYDDTNPTKFVTMDCPLWEYNLPDVDHPTYHDISTCVTTNIGGALRLGGNQFATNANMNSVWVMVLLTDGYANATCMQDGENLLCGGSRGDLSLGSLPIHFCPPDTNIGSPPPGQRDDVGPYCRAKDTTVRHSFGSASYDANDYAMDAADFVSCISSGPAQSTYCKNNNVKGQGAVLFTIGLGHSVTSPVDSHGKPFGETLLRYMAAIGDDGDPSTDPCAGKGIGVSCGNYYFSLTGNDLGTIFDDIASRVFTRIAQ